MTHIEMHPGRSEDGTVGARGGKMPVPGGARMLAKAAREILTDDEIASLRAAQRRRLVFFAVLGIVLMVLGFFAGRHLRERSDGGAPVSQSIARHAPSAAQWHGFAGSREAVEAVPGSTPENAV